MKLYETLPALSRTQQREAAYVILRRGGAHMVLTIPKRSFFRCRWSSWIKIGTKLFACKDFCRALDQVSHRGLKVPLGPVRKRWTSGPHTTSSDPCWGYAGRETGGRSRKKHFFNDQDQKTAPEEENAAKGITVRGRKGYR